MRRVLDHRKHDATYGMGLELSVKEVKPLLRTATALIAFSST
jgi:hypothetical protein